MQKSPAFTKRSDEGLNLAAATANEQIDAASRRAIAALLGQSRSSVMAGEVISGTNER